MRLNLCAKTRVGYALVICLMLSGALLLGGCRDKISTRDSDTGKEAPKPDVKKGVKPVADTEAAVVETEFGNIVIELYPNLAPKTVERFKQLIKDGFYNGTTFHRINSAAGLLQGGDPLSKDDNPENDGTGSSSYPNLPHEFNDIPYERGTVGAARQGEGPGLTTQQAWDTANCQFFITLLRQDTFDGQYTVFGRVIDGVTNADVIAHAPVVPGTESPSPKIVIKSIKLVPRSNYK
ncbi:MAG: peptidylprolyl isomerase [Acidobacteria bacterium]|nr:peptidylprolyl isomerase [Acidobacteriota bacterium]